MARIDDTWPAGILVPKRNFVYIPIPKVACTSIKARIAKLENKRLLNNDPHQTQFQTISLEATYNSPLPSFAFVRHPVDRLYSCWKDKVSQNITKEFSRFPFYSGMSFKDFVDVVKDIPDDEADGHFRSQYAYVYHRSFKAVTYVAKLENCEEEWRNISDWLKLPYAPLETRNSTGTRQPISSALLELIHDRYEIDFNKFNYEVDYGGKKKD